MVRNMKNDSKNPWKPEDERDHQPVEIEWWCSEAFFKIVENNKNLSLNASFTEGSGKFSKIESMFKMTLFDLDKNEHFECLDVTNKPLIKKATEQGGFDIRYKDSYMKGLFPDYEMRFHDSKNNILVAFKFHAKSIPHWIAQDITNGRLPLGLGFYKYGYIPKLDMTGTLKLNNNNYKITGTGYFEKVWGDSSFINPFTKFSNFKQTINTYSKLWRWWLKYNRIKIPKSITFTSENNPIGYDWIWAVLDNGWTIFYGNVMVWIMDGPAAGIFILSKDDVNYEEFGNIHFRYNKIRFAKKFDFCYPSEIELVAAKEDEKLNLTFTMTSEPREYYSPYPYSKYWRTLSICEAPGKVEGFYHKNKKKTKLSGFCKIEPQRKISMFGHNSLKLDFILPPDGVGLSCDLDSHFFKKKISTKIQLTPRPKIKLNFEKITDSKIHSGRRIR